MANIRYKIGDKHGMLTIRGIARPLAHGERRFACECECGYWTIVKSTNLYPVGRTRSCGCYRREIKSRQQSEARKQDRIRRTNNALAIPAAPENESRAERRLRYIALREQGFRLSEIAKAEGCSPQYIHQEINS